MLQFIWKSRRRRIATVGVVLSLAATGAAVAALVIYSGLSGQTSGTIETATTNSAFSIQNEGSAANIPVGGSASAEVRFTNTDPTATHTLTAISGTFSSNPSQCASHLSYAFNGNPVGLTLGAGQAATFGITYSADASVPVAACSGATWSVDWTGQTNP